jgi:hypothetical protein
MSLQRKLGPKLGNEALMKSTPLWHAVDIIGGEGGVKRAAKMIGVSRHTLKSWIERGKPPDYLDEKDDVILKLIALGGTSLAQLQRGADPAVISAFKKKNGRAKK